VDALRVANVRPPPPIDGDTDQSTARTTAGAPSSVTACGASNLVDRWFGAVSRDPKARRRQPSVGQPMAMEGVERPGGRREDREQVLEAQARELGERRTRDERHRGVAVTVPFVDRLDVHERRTIHGGRAEPR